MSFDCVYGQEKQTAILRRALTAARVPHAYLFYGMRGIGKQTVARQFAKALNCKKGNGVACEQCPSCLKITNGNHPDVVTIVPEGIFIKITHVREMQNQIKFKPFEGEKRVFIVVDAERMNEPAANALLKTLEEPSPANVLILVTSRPFQLPETILSRCQKLRFDPIRKETIVSFLEEKEALDRQQATIIASFARGSIGNAREHIKRTHLSAKKALIQRIATLDRGTEPLAVFALAHEIASNRETLLEKLDVLRDWYRDMLLYKETEEAERVMNPDILSLTKTYAEKLTSHDIVRCLQAVLQTYTALEQNANKQLTLETMMFKLLGV